ncbi:hypothetical protein RIF29_15745 [Crotalaria pallida]|uniref:18 kDa Sin3-associated polypeptide n=1 Tax=Crotalaria pallida TaxID=3830 RepID=A0AAN9FE44_CROPI
MSLSLVGEPCDKHTFEEEDLVDRSTKKLKPNNVDCSEVIMDDQISDGGNEKEQSAEEKGKPSYSEVVMKAAGYKPNPNEIIKMVQEELCPFLEEELRAKEAVKEFVTRPIIEVSHEEYEEWCRPWKNALIVNLKSVEVGAAVAVAAMSESGGGGGSGSKRQGGGGGGDNKPLPPPPRGRPGPPPFHPPRTRTDPVDREKTCPLLLRVFTKSGSHHSPEEFAVRGKEPKDEVQIYTWKDATLRELTDLVKEVAPSARRRNAKLSFAFVFPDKNGRFKVQEVGKTLSFGTGRLDDGKALADLNFEIGDYLDVAILDRMAYLSIDSAVKVSQPSLGLPQVEGNVSLTGLVNFDGELDYSPHVYGWVKQGFRICCSLPMLQ